MLSALGMLSSATLFAANGAAPGDPRITGPYVHENLSIFLIHSARNATGHKLLTLQEAMDQKKAVVYETGEVNELSIENQSSEDVYIQAGDIVKGGRQDRVLNTDFILPAHSGKLPISSFCVEQGRWSKRGNEAADQFASSNALVAGKSLKMAVVAEKDQGQVWSKVAQERQSLDMATVASAPPASNGSGSGGGVGSGGAGGGVVGGVPVRSVAQPAMVNASTSMQIALESKAVVDATGGYLRDLEKIVNGQNDVVGYAYAINGKLNSADSYASHELFLKMWPKLLRASAVEALTERPKAQASQKAPEISAVQAMLADADKAGESSKQVNGRLTVVKRDSAQVLEFETQDKDSGGGWMHKSYVVK
jgi:hypothetical protein